MRLFLHLIPAVTLLVTLTASAGPLDPPAAPAPTPGPEARVALAVNGPLPLTIDMPGSYYLTANVLNVSGSSAITISADGVTLDLNGFAVTAADEEESPSHSGIAITGSGATVSHGTLSGWSDSALSCSASDARVSDLLVSHCKHRGIDAGESGWVQACRVSECGTSTSDTGINAGSYGRVEDCRVRNCPRWGIRVGVGGLAVRCVVSDCLGCIGLEDAATASGCRVRQCTIGIAALSYCVVEGNTVAGVANRGVDGGPGSEIVGNTFDYVHSTPPGTARAIYLGSGGGTRIRSNAIVDTDIGVDLFGGHNTVVNNSFRATGTEVLNAGVTDLVGPFIHASEAGTGATLWNTSDH
jgi:hypothetical protein